MEEELEVSKTSSENNRGVGEDPYPSFAYILDEQYATFIHMGMGYNEYWLEDPSLAQAYIKAYDMKRSYDNDILWLQGAYVLRAMNHDKQNPYPSEPFPLGTNSEKNIEREKGHMNAMSAYMERFAKMTNEKYEKEE